MADEGKCAITAIADVRLEGSVTTSLHRLGWEVAYRATSEAGLISALNEYPKALVISSDDFRSLHHITPARQISLPSKTKSITDGELRELLRNLDQGQGSQRRTLEPTKARIYLVASNGRTVGASTIALNLAQELSKFAGSTLLLDCNSWSPYLARHLSINGINREIAITPFGFSVGEIQSRDSLNQLATSLRSYDRIIIDYGQLQNSIVKANGRRAHEEIFFWAIHAQSSLLLLSRNDAKSLEEAARTMEEIKQLNPGIKRHLLLTLTSVLSRRERARLVENSAARFGASCSLISRDRRSVLEMEEKGSTFSEVAPRSLVLGELRELMEELS